MKSANLERPKMTRSKFKFRPETVATGDISVHYDSKNDLKECLRISPARVEKLPEELLDSVPGKQSMQRKTSLRQVLLQSENRPPAYFMYNTKKPLQNYL